MPVEKTIEKLPPFVAFADVESIARRMEDDDPLAIGLTDLRRTRLFGEGALLGLVILARMRRKQVHVHLGGELRAYTARGASRYWKIFTESMAGFVLGQLADAIYDGTERDVTAAVRQQQSATLKANQGFIGSGKEIAAAIADRFGAPASAEVIRENNATDFRSLLGYTLAFRLGVKGEPGGALSNVAMFASELLENTRDHATTDLTEVPIDGVRFLNVRRINPDQEDVRELAPLQTEVGDFSDALASVLQEAQAAEHLIEMTVADSGPGIAARMAGNMDVYEGPLAEERRQLLKAISRGGSSKAASVTGRGLGLQNVLDATRALGGLLVFRTGRSRVYFFPTPGDAGSGGDVRGTEDPALPFLPGTSVSILFPWGVRDRQMDLFRVADADANCGR